MRSKQSKVIRHIALAAITLQVAAQAAADHVILDDLIVDGSACIGMDCVNGESFGFDTLRIKENNLRIKAEDTSATSSFPTNDWQITFNDSADGGANKFSIDDIDGGRTPFTIEAGAPSHSLYVDDGGRLGLGTSTPVVDIHQVSGNTPTLRLEQDGSSGFTPQTWDVAGNETNFFVRDVTNGSTYPLKIRPGAPTSAIDVAGASGYVGITNSSPLAKLHIKGDSVTEADVQVFVENSNSGADAGKAKKLFVISNNGPAKFSMIPSDTDEWAFNATQNEFRISKQGSGEIEMQVYDTGNMTILGTLTQGSSRTVKHDINEVDAAEVLKKVVDMPISTWSYNRDPEGIMHLGPMSEDFYQAFSLGGTDKGLTSVDTSGVALAAIQGLKQEKDEQIETLSAENKVLKTELQQQAERMLQLEMALSELLRKQSGEVQVGAAN